MISSVYHDYREPIGRLLDSKKCRLVSNFPRPPRNGQPHPKPRLSPVIAPK